MMKFSFINRFWFVFFDLMLVLVTVVSFYFGFERFFTYFSYPDFFVFSVFSVFSVLFFMISIPILTLSFSPIYIGFQSSIEFQKKVAKCIVFGLCFIVLLSLVFNYYYISAISNKGYIKCNGIPSGWMPGMATKYATSELLCSKKDP
ncbi:hypothetical protein SRDD_14460 [Serratia sp. DD3]|nr:hypothetical protein SRDD_14460 [Serratia sp. DD3]